MFPRYLDHRLSLESLEVIFHYPSGVHGCGFSQLCEDLREQVSDPEHETKPVVAVRSRRCRLHTACGNVMAMSELRTLLKYCDVDIATASNHRSTRMNPLSFRELPATSDDDAPLILL